MKDSLEQFGVQDFGSLRLTAPAVFCTLHSLLEEAELTKPGPVGAAFKKSFFYDQQQKA